MVQITRGGLDHHSGQRARRKAAGPHSGPYGTRPYRRVRGADRSPLADVMIEARAATSTHTRRGDAEFGLDHRSGHLPDGVQGFSLGWAGPRLKPWTPEDARWPER